MLTSGFSKLPRHRIRESVVQFSPALVLFLGVLINWDRVPFLERLLLAAFFAVVCQMALHFGYGLAYMLIRWVEGRGDEELSHPESPTARLAAALLLAAVVYTWLQHTKYQEIEQIAQCVDQPSYDPTAVRLSDRVRNCAWEGPGSRLYSGE